MPTLIGTHSNKDLMAVPLFASFSLITATTSPTSDFYTSISYSTSESWFLTEEWQAKEREADNDFKCGAFDTVDTIDELLALFDAKEKEIGEES